MRRSPALPVHPKNNACSAGNRFTAIVTKIESEPCKPSVTTCPKELLPCSCHAASGELHIGDLPVTSAWFGFRYEHKEEELWEEGT